jgi:alkyl sulfatase BDS1-like metallo-beta-lactamase superfamily hydrolase
VVAPAAFMEEAISENIMMDAAMGRRAMYQFGKNLPRNATGILDTGLGKGQAFGSFGILPPNQLISEQTQKLQIDGVDFVFHNVPGAECPAELSFSVPALKLYDGAEILAQTMHNLLPIRGAKVRDGLLWSTYLDQALEQSKDADIYMASHNWPVFGNANIQKFITVQRDVFKYTHDQTVRLMNEGYTPREITAMVKLPKALTSYFGARGYYGDLRHNVKAVYQFYLGNYDGNPANLNLLPPAESGKRYVELIGGADKVIAAGQAAFDKGDYQWAAELLNNAVLADANNKAAKELLARTYEQMGYMSEAATWRNSYLTGAMELRDGPPKKGISKANGIDILEQIPTEFFLTKMAASLDGPGADGKSTKINLTISDKQENWVLWLQNSVLHFKQAAVDPSADASLTLTHGIFVKMIAGTAGIKDTLLSDDLKISGSKIDLIRFFSLIDKPSGTHVIVTR